MRSFKQTSHAQQVCQGETPALPPVGLYLCAALAAGRNKRRLTPVFQPTLCNGRRACARSARRNIFSTVQNTRVVKASLGSRRHAHELLENLENHPAGCGGLAAHFGQFLPLWPGSVAVAARQDRVKTGPYPTPQPRWYAGNSTQQDSHRHLPTHVSSR